jgi:RecB family exonuclease
MAQHSYSGIKAYETCARKYYETKVLKLYPRVDTEATLYGTLVHEAAELYVKEGKPLEESFAFMEPLMKELVKMPGRHMAELEMAVTDTLEPCGFHDPNYWCRGIADLVIVDDDNLTARVFDFKTGSNKYPDTDQLMLMAMLIFKHFPHVRSVTGGLLFVLKNTVQKYKVSREQEEELWWRWRERVAKIDAAHTNGVWNPKQSGLCRQYCECITCEFNGRRT